MPFATLFGGQAVVLSLTALAGGTRLRSFTIALPLVSACRRISVKEKAKSLFPQKTKIENRKKKKHINQRIIVEKEKDMSHF